MINNITKLSHDVYDAIEILKEGDYDLNDIDYCLERMNLYEYLYFLDKILLKVDIGEDLLKILFDFNYDCLSQDSLFESGAVNKICFKKFHSYPYDLIHQISHYNIFDKTFTLVNVLNNNNLKPIDRLIISVNKKIKILSGMSNLMILTDQYSPEESFEYDEEDEWGNIRKQWFNHYNLVKKNAFDLISLPDFFEDKNLKECIKNTLQREIIDCLEIINSLQIDIYDYNYLALLPCLKSQQEFKKIVSKQFLNKKSNSFSGKKLLIGSIAEYSRRTNTDYYDFMLFKSVQTQRILNNGTVYVESTKSPPPIHYQEIIDWIVNEFKISLNHIRSISIDDIKKYRDSNKLNRLENLKIENVNNFEKITIELPFNQKELLEVFVTFQRKWTVNLNFDHFIFFHTNFSKKMNDDFYLDGMSIDEKSDCELNEKELEDLISLFNFLKSKSIIQSKRVDRKIARIIKSYFKIKKPLEDRTLRKMLSNSDKTKKIELPKKIRQDLNYLLEVKFPTKNKQIL